MNKKSFFIVLDGIDGCGKTTMVVLLKKYLHKKGYNVFLTHEPTKKTATGKKIQELLKKRSSNKYSRRFWLTLFTQDRLEHIEKIIIPKLKNGFIVISDRYYYSTLAYQLNEREWQSYLSRYALLKPDLVFILDVPALISLNRTKKRTIKTIFEKQKFLEKTRRKFLKFYKLKGKFKENIWLIDASQPKAKVFSDIKKVLEMFLS